MSHDLVNFDDIEIILTEKGADISENKIIIENIDEVNNTNSIILEDYDQNNCEVDHHAISNDLSYLDKIKKAYMSCNYIGATANDYKNSLKGNALNDKKNKLILKINKLKCKFPFLGSVIIDPNDPINVIESKYCEMRLKVLEELNQIEEPEKKSIYKTPSFVFSPNNYVGTTFSSKPSFGIFPNNYVGVTFSSNSSCLFMGPTGPTGPINLLSKPPTSCLFMGAMGTTGPYTPGSTCGPGS